MEKKARLGRGLDALLGTSPDGSPAEPVELAEVSVDAIDQNPYQPRKAFDDDELSSLSASIKTHGILQPLVVRALGDRYQLVAGERRLRAARAAGLPAVPVRVVDFNDQQVVEAALIENIQRSDLNPIEKAIGFKDYLDRFHMTHEAARRPPRSGPADDYEPDRPARPAGGNPERCPRRPARHWAMRRSSRGSPSQAV